MFKSLRDKLNSFVGRAESQAVESTDKKLERKSVDEPVERVEKKKDVRLTTATKIRGVVSSKVKLSLGDMEDTLWELHVGLIESDVAVETADYIIERLKEKLLSEEIVKGRVDEFVRDSIRQVLIDVLTPETEFDFLQAVRESDKPYRIVFLGVNGTGKTTTIAKVAHYLMSNGFSVVLAAGDTFRAGAIEQIEKHAAVLNLRVIKHQMGADSAAVVFDAVEHARAKKIDVVLADTAGRMQTNINLMDELRKICRVNKADLKIFVGDSLTGNDAVDQVKRFDDAVGVDAVILTKMDSDARGGSALSIVNEIGKPIIFVGVGQRYEDLKVFDRNWFVDQLL